MYSPPRQYPLHWLPKPSYHQPMDEDKDNDDDHNDEDDDTNDVIQYTSPMIRFDKTHLGPA